MYPTMWGGPMIDTQHVKDLHEELIQLNQAALILEGVRADYVKLARLYAFTQQIDESLFDELGSDLESMHDTIRTARERHAEALNTALGIENAPPLDNASISDIPF